MPRVPEPADNATLVVTVIVSDLRACEAVDVVVFTIVTFGSNTAAPRASCTASLNFNLIALSNSALVRYNLAVNSMFMRQEELLQSIQVAALPRQDP